jgi:hypothetical protein
LDAAIRTLPNFPLIQNMTVTPLIRHPVEEAYEEEYGPMPPLGLIAPALQCLVSLAR